MVHRHICRQNIHTRNIIKGSKRRKKETDQKKRGKEKGTCHNAWHDSLFFETGFPYVSLSVLELTLLTRLASTQRSACLCLQSTGIKDMHQQPVIKKKFFFQKRKLDKGWRGGSVVRTDSSSRGSEFNSQKQHSGSQPSVMGSYALFWCV